MAVTPRITIKQSADCESIVICDVTGGYKATREGGYGFPNVNNADHITLTVTPQGGTASTEVTLKNADGTNFTPGLNADGVYEPSCIRLKAGDVGLTSFADGVHTFVYSSYSTADVNDGSETKTIFFKCEAQKCINKIVMSTCDEGCLGCGDSLVDLAFKMKVLLDAAEYSTSVGALACANKILKRVQDTCDNHCTNCH
tara:strand:+ start:294 stop:890 length:597 start_codon:yes stop_codon:yes gene_type:complete